jgi:MFS transporter, OCT family, solute carrier family 22 (organic cation transporter), member 4/5
MKFDTFLATINDWGRFQKVKYTLICLTYMLPSMMVYTYTFTAAKPNFRCMMPTEIGVDQYNGPFNQQFDSQYKPTIAQCSRDQKGISLSECQRCFIKSSEDNQTLEKCDEYVFDRKHYQDTLVEEVSKKARPAND